MASDLAMIVPAVLRAMGSTFRNFFRKPVTVHYPDKPRVYLMDRPRSQQSVIIA